MFSSGVVGDFLQYLGPYDTVNRNATIKDVQKRVTRTRPRELGSVFQGI